MARLPRTRLQAAVAGCLAAVLLCTAPARPQQPAPEPVVPGASGGPYAADSDQADTRLPRIAKLIPQYLADKEWDTLAHALQALLEVPHGTLLRERLQDADGRPYVHWRSPHAQANAVLGKLSPEALAVYNEHYAPVGRELLNEARKKNDVRLLAEVAQRYFYTAAGPEALARLAAEHVEAGQMVPAALCYERLLDHARAQPSAFALYQAAVVFRKAGAAQRAELAWKRLQEKIGKDGLRIEGQKLTARQIKQELERVTPLPTTAPSDWPLFLGSATRNARGKGGRPDLGKVLWQRPTLMDRFEETGEADKGQELKPFLDRALKLRADEAAAPVLPGFFPLAVGDKVIYRTYLGVTAVSATEVKDRQGKVEARPGEIEWKSTELDGSLGLLFSDPYVRPTLTKWAQLYDRLGVSALLFENPMAGALSADGRYAYVIDDLGLPPPPGKQPTHPKLDPLVSQNSLQAFNLRSGKIEWRLGNSWRKDDPFNGTHWLGPPLPLGGMIYALNETNVGALRLVCIDPKSGKVLSVRPLATVQDRFAGTLVRRTQPVHLAYRDGVLVCPTNAGGVLAVDPATQALLWGYTYREGRRVVPAPPKPGPVTPARIPLPGWRNTAPVIVDGKVVFTAPDEDGVHCLNLRDGSLVWRKARREDDLYLAGVFGKAVLVVGKSACRALDLASGKELWKLDTGVPSGMGAASGDTYHLPLRSAVESKRPAVCVLDVAKGRVAGFIAAGKETPGNLLFHGGQLISQGPTTITAYALRKEGRE
jgi:outer membrane protein assembly factor BamB